MSNIIATLVISTMVQGSLSYHHLQDHSRGRSVETLNDRGSSTGLNHFPFRTRPNRQIRFPQDAITFDSSNENGFNWNQIERGGGNRYPNNNVDRGERYPNNNFESLRNDDEDFFIFDVPEANAFRRRPRPSTTPRVPTTTVAIPGMGTPRTPCEDACFLTPQYNPVCGDDRMTYFNEGRLRCAQRCGKQVNLNHLGACSRPPRG